MGRVDVSLWVLSASSAPRTSSREEREGTQCPSQNPSDARKRRASSKLPLELAADRIDRASGRTGPRHSPPSPRGARRSPPTPVASISVVLDRYRRPPPASPAVKTSSPCLPPRGADRAVGGIRAGIENSGRRASATIDTTPIPSIRPKSQQFVATARSPTCPTGAPGLNDPGISSARRGGSVWLRGGAVLQCRRSVTTSASKATVLRADRSRATCSRRFASRAVSATSAPSLADAGGLESDARAAADHDDGLATQGSRATAALVVAVATVPPRVCWSSYLAPSHVRSSPVTHGRQGVDRRRGGCALGKDAG